ncbi:MAG: glycosyltransferase [Candidatus Omnitrophica bacterium]|nr:glycosyltransferase [Candidatus Omnitrophota bacterium]
MTQPSVAVVIPAFNAEQTLPFCLQAVTSQNIPPQEIIVVDDGSSDRTSAVAGSFPEVRCVRQDNAGPAAARNRGQRETGADIVLFTDSDCVPAPDWVAAAAAGFVREDIGAVAGSYDIINPGSRLARCIHAEILYRHLRLLPEYPRAFGSFNVAIRRDVYVGVGGFDESYPAASGEDNDLSYRIRRAGYKIRFDPRSRVGHHHPERVVRYLREQFRHGFWRVKMYRAHPHMAGGDDYTFWKDIAEVGLAGLTGLALLILPFGLPAVCVVVLGGALMLLQAGFCFRICPNMFDGIFYSLVLFLRAFARAIGFSSGMLSSFGRRKTKKS